MKLQTDPKVIATLASEREDDNWLFRSFLKGLDPDIVEVDSVVHAIYEEVASQIDCRACGNCCREMLPTLTEDDVGLLATGLGTTPEAVERQYLVTDEEGDVIFNQRPCPFLSENQCRVYDCRPETCRSYPHLQKREFVIRSMQAVWNCSICPIVFNVFERMKAELWHEQEDIW